MKLKKKPIKFTQNELGTLFIALESRANLLRAADENPELAKANRLLRKIIKELN